MSQPSTITPARPEPGPAGAAPAPDWRSTLRHAGRCWFGAAVLILVLAGPLVRSSSADALGAMIVMVTAAAVLATLTALVIESLADRPVPIRAHVALAAAAGAVVTGLASLHPGMALVGGVACAAAAGLGGMLTTGRPTWRRYAALAGTAVVLGAGIALSP